MGKIKFKDGSSIETVEVGEVIRGQRAKVLGIYDDEVYFSKEVYDEALKPFRINRYPKYGALITKKDIKDLKKNQLTYDYWKDFNKDNTVDWLEYIECDLDDGHIHELLFFNSWLIQYHITSIKMYIIDDLRRLFKKL